MHPGTCILIPPGVVAPRPRKDDGADCRLSQIRPQRRGACRRLLEPTPTIPFRKHIHDTRSAFWWFRTLPCPALRRHPLRSTGGRKDRGADADGPQARPESGLASMGWHRRKEQRGSHRPPPRRVERRQVRPQDRQVAARGGEEPPLGRAARQRVLLQPSGRRRKSLLRHQQRRRVPPTVPGLGRSGLPARLPAGGRAICLATLGREAQGRTQRRLARGRHLLVPLGRRRPPLVRHQSRRGRMPGHTRACRRQRRRAGEVRGDTHARAVRRRLVVRHDRHAGRGAAIPVELLRDRRGKPASRGHGQRPRSQRQAARAPSPQFHRVGQADGQARVGRQFPGREHPGRPVVEPFVRRARRRPPGDLRRRRRMALRLRGRARSRRPTEAPLEVRLQPQDLGLGRCRIRRPQYDHLHARRARGQGLHRHGSGPRVGRGSGRSLVYQPHQARRRQCPTRGRPQRQTPSAPPQARRRPGGRRAGPPQPKLRGRLALSRHLRRRSAPGRKPSSRRSCTAVWACP